MSEVTEVKTKKQIPERTAIKAIITSYVCYGLITFFIYNLLKSSISSLLVQSIEKNLPVLGYIIPTMFGIITLVIIHLLCRISTFDVFKKCSMDASKTDYVMKNLKIFFVIVILASMFYSFTALYISINLDSQSVQISTLEYSRIFSSEHSKLLVDDMINDFNNFRDYAFKDAFISEAFFIIGFISLSSFQRNMIETYNGKAPRKSTKTEVETKKEGKH